MFGRRRNRSAPQALDIAEQVRRRVASGQAFDAILGPAANASAAPGRGAVGPARAGASAQVLSFDETPVFQAPGATGLSPRVEQQVLKRALGRLQPDCKVVESQRALKARVVSVLDAILAELRLYPDAEQRAALLQRLTDEMADLGPLAGLLRDPSVGDVMVNGPDRVYVQRRDRLQPTNLTFLDQAHLLRIARRLLGRAAVALDQGQLSVAAWRPDGSRVQLLLPPLSPQGPALALRRFRHEPLPLTRLVHRGSLTPAMARFLELAVQCRLNILVCGARQAGKTTLLNALGQLIAPAERIVTVEQAQELRLEQPHVLQLDTAPLALFANAPTTLSESALLKSALAMRPGRLLVGELRGGEAATLLEALDDGQDGTLATVTAEQAEAALERLEGLAGWDPAKGLWPALVSRALDLIVQVELSGDGLRRVTRIGEPMRGEDGQVAVRDLFVYGGGSGTQHRPAGGWFKSGGRKPRCLNRAARFGCGEEMTALIG